MATLYRVENPDTLIGLWYNKEGIKTDFIRDFGGMNKDLPMEFDENFAGGWFSAGENLEQMKNWFNAEDVATLSQAGYGLYQIEVPHYRIGHGANGIEHALFRREGAMFTPVPTDLLDLN